MAGFVAYPLRKASDFSRISRYEKMKTRLETAKTPKAVEGKNTHPERQLAETFDRPVFNSSM